MIDKAITLFLVLIALSLFTVSPLFAIAAKPLFGSELNPLLENAEKNENGIIFEGSHDKPDLIALC